LAVFSIDSPGLASKWRNKAIAPYGPRLTNALSKRFENHCHALAILYFWYNWTRIHKTLRTTLAMAAGLTEKLMDMADLVRMIDEREEEQKRAAIRSRFEVGMKVRAR
jgi:hypothetical protein